MLRRFVWVSLISLLSVAPASALPVVPEVRPRVGASFTPDQFVVGVQGFLQARLGGLARIAPGIDMGFGDDITSTLLNIDLLSMPLSLGGNGIALYAGAGVGFAWYSGSGETNSEIGVNLVAGADLKDRFYVESRFGMDTMPDLRLLAGVRLIKK